MVFGAPTGFSGHEGGHSRKFLGRRCLMNLWLLRTLWLGLLCFFEYQRSRNNHVCSYLGRIVVSPGVCAVIGCALLGVPGGRGGARPSAHVGTCDWD